MSVTIHHGDSREVLKTLADASIDSVVCDPPYALVSITKRFGGSNARPPIFDAVLIEREAEYVADIRRRIAWAQGEGRLTAQEMAKVADISADDLPLFAQPGEAA